MPDLVGVVGGKSAKALGTLGITTVEELLAHYPRRYAERGELTDLASLKVGEQVTVLARVASATSRPLKSKPGERRRRSITEVVVTDGTGELTLTFFNQDWIVKNFRDRPARAVRRDGRGVQRQAPAAASGARVRRRGGGRRGGGGLRGSADRGVPGDGEGEQLDHRPDRAHGAAGGRDVARSAGCRPACPGGGDRPADGAAVGPSPDRPGPGSAGRSSGCAGTRRSGSRWCWPSAAPRSRLLRRSRGPVAPAGCATSSTPRCRSR